MFRVRWGRLPLTQRLTLLFTAVAASVVLGLGALFLVESERHFVELDRMALQNKQRLIEDLLRNANSADDARGRLGEALSYHHGLYALVQDGQGFVVFQSQGLSPPMRGEEALHTGEGPAFGVWHHGNARFHTLAFKAAPAYSPTPLSVWIAADTEHHTQFLDGLRRDMKSRAARVTGQKLGERMPVQAVPVEMADLAQALNRMLDRLQEDFQRLTDFASDLAHELRTPISNLLTQTQVALAARRDAATYRDILASNAEEFERLARMVSDMLLLAKTARGVDLPHKERFSARQDALALLDFYEAVAEEKHIRLRVEGDGEIEGDRLMFRRAVSNLLSNALRHAPEAGEVTIRIAATAQATTVTVENTGADIDAKTLPRLFDRFYRADASRAHTDTDGSGLGLAITRAIAEAHGGSVTASSGQGHTCFTLVFPYHIAKPSS